MLLVTYRVWEAVTLKAASLTAIFLLYGINSAEISFK